MEGSNVVFTPTIAGIPHELCQWLALVTRSRLRYTQEYLTSGICSLIKPAAMKNAIPAKILSHVLTRNQIKSQHCFYAIDPILEKRWPNDPARAFVSGSVYVYHVISMRAAIVYTIYLYECATLHKIRRRLFHDDRY